MPSRLNYFHKIVIPTVFLWSVLGLHNAVAGELPRGPMMLISNETTTLRARAEIGLQFAAEEDLFWNLDDVTTPAENFDNDRYWWEGYIKPGLDLKSQITPEILLYGGLSAVASGTLEKDAFAAGNTGRVTLEEGYGGLQYKPRDHLLFDISAGPQEYKVGNGMLISNGASNGFERGALKLGPRKAFAMTGIGRVTSNDIKTELFYLDANELPDNDSGNQMVGLNVIWQPEQERHLGLTYGNVVQSGTPYPKAPPGGSGIPSILPGAREGLNFVHGYGRWSPLKNDLPNLWIAGDLAHEWNEDIDLKAWGGRAEIGYHFKDVRWQPRLSYHYQYFSGDDPDTQALERFDPLFYEGNPDAWSTGSKSSMVFINTNVNAHQITLGFTPTEKDIVTIYAAYIQASELRSPLQFGQATRLSFSSGAPDLVTGVTSSHLSNDILVKHTHILNDSTYLTMGYSASFPGKGMDEMVGGDAPIWAGIFANVVFNF